MAATIEQAAPYEGVTAVAENGHTLAVPSDPAVPYAMGWVRDLPDIRDFTTGHEEIAGILNARPVGDTICADAPKLDARVDLRQWCSPIEDQRDIGSCTAKASGGVVQDFERRALCQDPRGLRG